MSVEIAKLELVETVREHKGLLKVMLPPDAGLIYKQAVVDMLERSGKAVSERVRTGVYFVHTGLTRVALDAALGEKWQAALGIVAGRRRSARKRKNA